MMQIFKFNYSFITVLILLTLLAGCTHQKGNKVGFLLHNLEGRWSTDMAFLEKHAKDEGLELVVKNAGGDENRQLQQAEELIKEGVGVILVVPVNQNTAAGIVRDAHEVGVKVIAYDRIIMNADLDYLLTYQYEEIGQLIAEYTYNKVPRGNYVMLWGDASDNNAQLMRKGQESFLKPYVDRGDINMVYRSYTEGWADVVAYKTMQQVIDFSDQKIDVVMASNDNIGLAALKIFNENKIEKPEVITGQDATLDACRSILADGQTMSVYKSTNQMAKQAIDLAKDVLQGNKIDQVKGSVNNNRKDVPTLFLKPLVVDKTNVYNAVVDDGLYTKEELFDK